MISNNIDSEIKQAMLAKDQVKLRGLRAIKAALLLAKTEKGGPGELTEDAEMKILQKLVKQRNESAEIYQAQGRADLYQVEKEEMDVINAYLPKQLADAELTAIIKQIIQETGAQSIKEMGKVMGMANAKLAGSADGKRIGEMVKAQLQAMQA